MTREDELKDKLDELKEQLANIKELCESSLLHDITDFQSWDKYMYNMEQMSATDAFEKGEEYGRHTFARHMLDVIKGDDQLAAAIINSAEEEEDTTVASCSQSSGFS